MEGNAVCHGAATIITGFATGAAGAYGIGLENRTKVALVDDGSIVSKVNGEDGVGTVLAEAAVKRTLERFGMEYGGAVIETTADIPHAAGLKSSSIAANAIVLATVAAVAQERGKISERRLNKFMSEQIIEIDGKRVGDIDIINIGIDAAFDANVTKTGAIDDASAAYFGGFTLTQNLERKIVRQGGIEDLTAVIYLPDEKIYSADIKVDDVKGFAKEVDLIWENAMAGNIYQAITLNGLIHSVCFSQDIKATLAALDAGAIACGLSGTGPSVVALARDDGGSIEDAWKGLDGKVIKTRTNNKKARVMA